MEKVKIGINGMGRIGRTILREYILRNENKFNIVAVNNLGNIEEFTHLLKYDSTHGQFKHEIKIQKDSIVINNKSIKFLNCKNPQDIPWSEQGVQIVIDATGKFKDRESLSHHIKGSVKKVVLCSPGLNLDATYVLGINHHLYDPSKHHIISNASCTTNCITPIARIIHSKFEILNGFMLTVHSYTSDQVLLDKAHSDPRRGRAANLSIIPTTTGATKTLGEIIPDLKGKIDGYSIRVPVQDVSLADLTFNVQKKITRELINETLKEAAETYLKGIIKYETEELVSVDYLGTKFSTVIDSKLTNVIDNSVKIVLWYDNECGFSNRILDLVKYISSKGLN